MPVSQKNAPSKFPLRLMPSVRKVAENFSEKEGVSLNQFINIAVAEKLAHLQHEEWLARRPKFTNALVARALHTLDQSTGFLPQEFDKVPPGYKSARNKHAANRTAGRRRG